MRVTVEEEVWCLTDRPSSMIIWEFPTIGDPNIVP